MAFLANIQVKTHLLCLALFTACVVLLGLFGLSRMT